MDQADHDAVIRLQSGLEQLTATIAANNIASVERDTRIETAVKAINGTVRKHDHDIYEHLSRPHPDVTEEESHELIKQHREMWSAYGIGKWVGVTVGTAAIVQSVGIVILLVRGIG